VTVYIYSFIVELRMTTVLFIKANDDDELCTFD